MVSQAKAHHFNPQGFFENKGNSKSAFCKGSQSYVAKTAFTEVPATMPNDQNWLTKCNKHTEENGETFYLFDTSAPKLQGFYHPLFYQSYTTKQRSGKSKTLGIPVESDPSPNIPWAFQAPQLVVDNDEVQETQEEYHIFGKVNELWDYEEAYVYNAECERNQFLM